MIRNLKWYEWVGWLVNILMTAMAILFIIVNIMEAEMRAAGIGLLASATLIGILLCYGKPEKEKIVQQS
ncbi:MAG: hypothetical protein JRJ57_12580 [Deltaproteobacteria bacterium]|nr:hypothetical protein [Deltaproteobacteria bacterium]